MRFSGASREQGEPADRRLVRVEPAGRGDLPRRRSRRRRRPASSRTSCFRQVELAGVLRGARNEEGARKLIDFMLSKRFQEDIPLRCSSSRSNRDAALPPEFEQFAVVPERPLELAARRDRGEPRALGGRVDATSCFGERSCWRAVAYGVPLAFLALFFLYPLAAIVERGLAGRGGDPPLDVLTDPLTREVVWFTVWQALASTAADARGRAPRRVRARALPVPRARASCARSSSSRSCCRPSSSRSRSSRSCRRRLERGWVPILIAHAFFNVAVVVRVVGTFWASLDPRVSARRRRRSAPAPGARCSRGHAAAARARARRGGGDRLPLLVHVVRGRPDPRRAAVRDDRGRDLQPGGPAVRPARGGRARRSCSSPASLATVWVATRLERTARGRRVSCVRSGTCSGRRGRPATRRSSSDEPRRARALPRASRSLVLVERSLAVGGGYGLDAYRALGDDRRASSSSRRGRRS